MTLTILYCPLHAPSAKDHPRDVTTTIERLRPTFAAPTEAYGVIPALQKMNGYRLVLEEGGRDARRGQKDNPILVENKHPNIGSGQIHGCPPSTPRRIAPERWITFAAIELPRGPHAHVSLHPHAGIQGKEGGLAKNDRGQKFALQMTRLDQLLQFIRAMDWTCSVSGDLNFRDVGNSPASPYRIMRAHDLTVESDGINAIGWTKALRMDVQNVTTPRSVTDHPWMKATAR